MENPKLFAILNLTEDSFSDGGKYLDPQAAIQRAYELVQEGAYGIDLGAQSSNPQAKILGWKEEWRRILPVWEGIRRLTTESSDPIRISIDSYNPEILERAWERGLDYWNDITALRNPGMEAVIRNHRFQTGKKYPKFILMFSHNRGRIAELKSHLKPETILESILDFFRKEKDLWLSWGIPEEHLIYDPGMGFFLGEDPELSLEVIRNISCLQEELGKILVSVSRKSFLGAILGGRPPLERRYATFATELYLASKGIDYIRTHEISPIRDMMEVYGAIHKTIHETLSENPCRAS